MSANMENSAVARDWKGSVCIPIPKKGSAKECSNYRTIALISHASKVMLKIFQAMLQQYMNHKLPDVEAVFRKVRGTTDQMANIRWIINKQGSSRKRTTSALLTIPKTLTVWITINVGEFWKWWEYQSSWPAFWEASSRSESSSLNGTWNDWFHLGKGICQGCILSLCLFNFYAEYLMRNTMQYEAEAGIKFARRNNLRYADDTTLMAEREELKRHLMKSKEESETLA